MISQYLSTCFLILATGLAAPATVPDVGPSQPAPGADGKLNIAELIAHTTRLRGQEFTAPVQWEVLPPDELRTQFAEVELNEANLALAEKVLKKFGLIPEDLNLRQTLLALLGEQVAGYYDPKTAQLFALDPSGIALFDVLGPQAAAAELNHTLVHELTHALQDQHYDLEHFIDEDALTRGEIMDDVIAARLALAEGDATMVGVDYMLSALASSGQGTTSLDMPPGMLDGLIDAMAQGGMPGTTELAAAPPYLRQSLFFPYAKGFKFAADLRRRGGWAAVDAAYRSPPESTEQILHLERYGTDHPTPVPAVDLQAVLGSAWQPERPANMGELDIQLLVREYLGPEQAETAGTGWDGDRLIMHTHAGTGEVRVVWISVWDSRAEAQEFATAYQQVLEKRYGPVSDRTGPVRTWRRPTGDLTLERRGEWVLVVDALPAETLSEVRDRVWSAIGDRKPTP